MSVCIVPDIITVHTICEVIYEYIPTDTYKSNSLSFRFRLFVHIVHNLIDKLSLIIIIYYYARRQHIQKLYIHSIKT